MQWNCQSLMNKLSEFQHRTNNFDIILLSETWLQKKDNINIKNFDIIRKDRSTKKGGGVAILIRNGIKYQRTSVEYNCNGQIELCSINLFINNEKWLIISCYKSPDNNITENNWKKFLDQFNNKKILIAGDLNAHHHLWGDEKIDTQGKRIYNAIDDTNLFFLNQGKKTYKSRQFNTETAIDITIIDCSTITSFNWDVNDETWGSDHYPIFINLNERPDKKIINKASERLHNTKTNWEEIVEKFKIKINDLNNIIFNTQTPIQVKYTTLTATITDCFYSSSKIYNNYNNKINKYNPKKKSNKLSNGAPWWDEHCEKLIRIRRANFKKLKEYPNRENFDNYTKIEKQTRKELKKIKDDKKTEFLESLTKHSSPKYIWSKMKSFKNQWNKKTCPNEYNEKMSSVINQAIDSLCPPTTRPTPINFQQQNNTDPFLDNTFTMEELEYALSNLRLNSAPGEDKIDYKTIKNLSEELKPMILHLYNEIFNEGIFPDEWKQYKIFFIPKQDNKKVRPISLAPCLLKIFEKMLNLRLTWWLEHHNKMPSTQYGFRAGKSCVDNLSQIQTEILLASENKESTIGLFIDIKSAYDNVIDKILNTRLKNLGIPLKTQIFIHNLISDRRLHFNYDEIDEYRLVYRGLPQGSVLSPILYTIYMLELENVTTNCKVVQFADDVCFFTRTQTTRIALQNIKTTIDNTSQFLKNSGLEIAPEKCQLIVFNEKNNNNWKLKIENTTIKSKDTIKFLGLTFQSSGKWNKQVDIIKKKCIQPLSIIKYLRSTWKGADPSLMLKLYKALIRSRIEYGAFLFNLTTSQQNILDKIQYQAVRLSMGYRQSTPTNVMLAESKEIPLEIRFKYLCKNYLCKILNNDEHPVTKSIQNLFDIYEHPTRIQKDKNPMIIECFQSIEKIKHYIDYENVPVKFRFEYSNYFYEPIVSFDEGKLIQKTKKADDMFNTLFGDKLKNTIAYFTDGSKSQDKSFVGFAYVCTKNTQIKKSRTTSYASIFSAEAMAIHSVLLDIKKRKEKEYLIFSDSQSVLLALHSRQNMNKRSHIIYEIKKELMILNEQDKKVKLHWVPAHVGIKFNEMIDEEAKKSINDGIDSQILIPHSDFKSEWKKQMREEYDLWCLENSKTKGIEYFNHYYKKNTHPWFHNLKFKRKSIVTINRMRSGHNSTYASLKKFKIKNDSTCDCGISEDNLNHIFFQCNIYARQRKFLIKNFIKNKKFPPYNIEAILSNMGEIEIINIARFINSIKKCI